MDLPQELTQSAICRGTILHSTLFEEIDHGTTRSFAPPAS